MNVMISAGEASGDIHAAELVKALKKHAKKAFPDAPDPAFFGMGGNNLAANGVELLVDVENNAVMGLLEVLHKYPSLRANLNALRKALRTREPDILILVDYPHFNMKLAATARELGIPVLFFIAPKVWASRAGRVTELKKLVDHMALILPFEQKIFQDAGIPSTYVGNPLLDNKPLLAAADKPRVHQTTTKRIALLPGSRRSEVSLLLPPMLETCQALRQSEGAIEFVLPVADTIDRNDITQVIEQHGLDVTLIEPTDYESLRNSDAALVASGTATLELAILGIPMVVIYRLNAISYRVLKRILTTDHISLVNIIANKSLVPEILQDDVTAENLAQEVGKLLNNAEVRDQQIAALKSVYDMLGKEGASQRTAKLALSLVRVKEPDLAVS